MPFASYPASTGGGGFPGYGSVVGVGTANSNGTSAQVSRADHVHAHDNQPGGLLHALVAAGGDAGFMSGADKTKLDGIAPGATATPLSNATPNQVGAIPGDPGASTSASRADHMHEVAVAPPVTIGTVNSEGASAYLTRADHVHAHGNQAGGSLHADVIPAGASGFMTGADKSKLDGVDPAARAMNTIDIGVDFGTALEDMVTGSGTAAWIAAGTIFFRALVLPNAADHDPEDVLLEEIEANVESVVATTVNINVFAPNTTWGRYTVRLIGYNP